MPTRQSAHLAPSPSAEFPSVDILGVRIHNIDTAQFLNQVNDWIVQSRSQATSVEDSRPLCHQICTVNPEFVVDARNDADFAEVLRRADIRVADGAGIMWAARIQGGKLRERITGSDGIYRICERAAQEGWRVFFLGAAPGVAQRTANTLRELYPGLIVAGTYAGSPQERDWPHIERRLRVARPDVLLVAFGHPRQDIWIDRHRAELPAAVAIGIGGAFDFVAGVTVRAPVTMRRLGLEWLHRLVKEPWRWRRMSKLPEFATLAVRQSLHLGK